jgi:hypothetical protein
VAELVVDRLETVDVQESQRVPGPGAGPVVHRRVQGAAVRQPGQLVGERQPQRLGQADAQVGAARARGHVGDGKGAGRREQIPVPGHGNPVSKSPVVDHFAVGLVEAQRCGGRRMCHHGHGRPPS